MPLTATKHKNETWRECVIRYAENYGLKEEVLSIFDEKVEAGVDKETAAWEALYEWDLLDFTE